MKILLQLAALFALCLLGELISSVLPITFPGNIIAMVMLFALLGFKVIKAESLRETTALLLGTLGLFFMPPIIGILDNIPLFWQILVPLLVIGVASSILTFWVTAATATLVSKILEHVQHKQGGGHD
jgi:holin-like protein